MTTEPNSVATIQVFVNGDPATAPSETRTFTAPRGAAWARARHVVERLFATGLWQPAGGGEQRWLVLPPHRIQRIEVSIDEGSE